MRSFIDFSVALCGIVAVVSAIDENVKQKLQKYVKEQCGLRKDEFISWCTDNALPPSTSRYKMLQKLNFRIWNDAGVIQYVKKDEWGVVFGKAVLLAEPENEEAVGILNISPGGYIPDDTEDSDTQKVAIAWGICQAFRDKNPELFKKFCNDLGNAIWH